MSTLQIIGRSSSHFTRLALIFAYELDVPFEFRAVYDMTQLSPEIYAGNPSLKLPILRSENSVLFGSQNICRAIADRAQGTRRLVWPEQLPDERCRNAHELVAHCMSAQVQLIFGTAVCKLPPDNLYFIKARTGFEASLAWLDAHLLQVLDAHPPHELSYFKAALFCLMDHLHFRETVSPKPYPSLLRLAEEFALRPSAKKTPYRFDTPPTS